MAVCRAIVSACAPLSHTASSLLGRRVNRSGDSDGSSGSGRGRGGRRSWGGRCRGEHPVIRASFQDLGVSAADLQDTISTFFLAAPLTSTTAPLGALSFADLFPDLPDTVLGVSVPDTAISIADAAAPAASAAYSALPDATQISLSDWWQDEVASGFTLVTGNAEYELTLAVLLFLWATSRPGVLSGAFDAYVVSALDSVLRQKRFAAANIRTTGKLGDGSFGVVYEAVESVTGRELVVKQAKSVQGATELQNAEEYMNRRVRRAPLASWGCAKYLGCYDVVKGAASPCLVGGGCTCTALWASLFHTPPAQLERVSQSKD
mmetsp:Transcript_9906/g.15857  ORF Transcript_9906/g.15857 Transcript_9906/m.15857 type:complete len:320 (-) Transcript_9906:50-1009(-)